jgi:hypothetical protein
LVRLCRARREEPEMDRYIVMRMNNDGTRVQMGGMYPTRADAQRAVDEVLTASRNGWAVDVVRIDPSKTR